MEKQPAPQTKAYYCKCPHCTCIFCTEADLKRHLEVYGETKAAHVGEFQRTHGRLEHAGFGDSE